MRKIFQHTSALTALVLVLAAALTLGACATTGGADNDQLASTVRQAIDSDPMTSAYNIRVEAEGGTVLLFGNVKTPEARIRASQLARDIDGVESVRNEITVRP